MKKKLIAITVALTLVLSSVTFAFATPIDVQYHWSGTAVNTLVENGIVSGYSNGRFRPEKTITREEVAKIVYKYIKTQEYQDSGNEPTYFPDVNKNRWSAEAIFFLSKNRIISGYPDGKFRPTRTLSRQELAAIADRCLTFLENPVEKPAESEPETPETTTDGGITEGAITEGAITPEAIPVDEVDEPEAIVTVASAPFKDIANSFAKKSIDKLYDKGIISGYSDNTFRPANTITRGETSQVIFKMSRFTAIKPKITLPSKKTIYVPYISQVYPVYAPVGCEGTSLLMGLKGKGYAKNTTLRQFLDAMPKHSSNPAKGFVGSPYKADLSKKTRTTIYPPKLAEYGRRYGKVTDASGYTPHELQSELLAGNPVVAYATLWWEKPYYRHYSIEGKTQRLLSNNHVILVCGYDRNTKKYYIADPYNKKNPKSEYRYWISASTFDRIYKERYHAVLVE